MKDKNDGGPAFPSPAFDNCALPGCEGGAMRGMTLRDWFAGMALQGVISMATNVAIQVSKTGASVDGLLDIEKFSTAAYEAADAMLAERSK